MTNTKLAVISSLMLSVPALAAAPVVGGQTVKPGKWPEVAVVVAPKALCTGTLIAPDVVLTAGHCIETHPFEVIIGTTDFSQPGGEKIQVAQAIAYPNWKREFDVGVLVLAHASKAQPRALASACAVRDHLVDGASVHVVGFGLTTANGMGENSALHEADLPVTDSACTRVDACNPEIAPGGELAAGGRGTDSCFGDSGGPVFLATASGPVLLGVVSRAETAGELPCAGGGVYERADKVGKWIEDTTHRTLTTEACDGKGDDQDGDPPARAGCSATGELAGGGALILLAGALWILTIPRRR
jgi:secreted trypsin-like serine protease